MTIYERIGHFALELGKCCTCCQRTAALAVGLDVPRRRNESRDVYADSLFGIALSAGVLLEFWDECFLRNMVNVIPPKRISKRVLRLISNARADHIGAGYAVRSLGHDGDRLCPPAGMRVSPFR